MVNSIHYIGYYINVDRMTKRRQFMETQLHNAGLDDLIMRWIGIDAKTDIDLEATSYLPGRWNSPRWELSTVEVACFESHRAIWNYMIENSTGPVVILEDDVILSKDFHNLVNGIVDSNIYFDVIKLDGICKTRRFSDPVQMNIRDDSIFEVRRIVQAISSSGGYMVSRHGAHKLLQWSTTFSNTVDAFIFCPRHSYILLQLFPAVCAQGVILFSDSGLTGHNSLFRHAEDIPTSVVDKRNNGPILYRAIREAKRGSRRVKRSLFSDKLLKRNGGFIGHVPLASDLVTLQSQKQEIIDP